MRITCPNCGAQYEVDARVIPDLGRDVQCSNCGHTWFQRPQSAVAASVRRVVEDPPVSPGPEADAPIAAQEDATTGAANRAAEAFPPISQGPGAAPPDTTDPEIRLSDAGRGQAPAEPDRNGAAPADVPAQTEADRPTIDEATRALLREEAEREAQARAAERRPAIETQGDLDLAGTVPPRATQRSADLSGSSDEAEGGASVAAASRRDNLPDVDSITSGLRMDPAGSASDDPAGDLVEPAPRRGFRAGFAIPLLFVAAAALVYIAAPDLADTVPALRAPLTGYVDSVNALRDWIANVVAGVSS